MKTRLLVVLLVVVSFATIVGSTRANAAGWTSLTVDTDGIRAVSLDVDDGNIPHISYFAEDIDGGTPYYLRYATIENSTWVVEQVSEEPVRTRGTTSIVVDQAGSPHIIYGRSDTLNGESVTHIEHAYKQSDGWVFEGIDTFPTSGCCADYYSTQLLIDSAGKLHLFYMIADGSYSDRKVKYAQRGNDGAWQLTTLVNKDYLFDVTIDEEDDFHFVYRSVDDGIYSLQYTEFTTVAGFAPELIYTGEGTLGRLSIATNASGTPFILYSGDSTPYSRQLFLMSLVEDSWVPAPIFRKDHNINDLVIDSKGRIHVFSIVGYGSGYSFTAYIEYYFQTADGWQEERLGSNYTTSSLSVAVDSAGDLHTAAIGVFTGTNKRWWLTYLKKEQVTHTVSGRITNNAGDGIPETIINYGNDSLLTDDSGNYTIDGLSEGNYTITPYKDGYTFAPQSRTVSVPPDASVQDFIAIPDTTTDTDGDGLPDEWEINGYDHDNDGRVDVDLPAMGADPYKPDIFVEVDWMESSNVTHRPDEDAIRKIVHSFAYAPVYDETGNQVGTGINLHVDVGPDSIDFVTGERWNENGQGNNIANYIDTIDFDDKSSRDQILQVVGDNFPEARRTIFHYSLWVNDFNAQGELRGGYSAAEQGDNPTFFVALGGLSNNTGSINEQAGTFMHELGHNLGLHHGGDQDPDLFNYKPNYLSIMNYSFQTGGLIIDGKDGCDECFDYSRFTLPTLHEAELYEEVGLNSSEAERYGTKYRRSLPWFCWPYEEHSIGHLSIIEESANGPIDWSCNGVISFASVQEDINGQGGNAQTLTGYNDWANLDFNYAHRHLRSALFTGSSSLLPSDELSLSFDPADSILELSIEEARTIPSISEARAQITGLAIPEQAGPLDTVTYTVSAYTIDQAAIQSFTPTVSLPDGFSYITNSTSGDISADPAITDNQLTWPSIQLPDNTTVREFSFQVQVGATEGLFSTDFGGTSSTGLVISDRVNVRVQPEQWGDGLFLPLVID